MPNHKKAPRTSVMHPMKPSEINHARLQAVLKPILKACNEARDTYLILAKEAQKSLETCDVKIKKLNKMGNLEPYLLYVCRDAYADIKNLYEMMASDFEYVAPKKAPGYVKCPELENLIGIQPWDFTVFDVLKVAVQVEDQFCLMKKAAPAIKKSKVSR